MEATEIMLPPNHPLYLAADLVLAERTQLNQSVWRTLAGGLEGERVFPAATSLPRQAPGLSRSHPVNRRKEMES